MQVARLTAAGLALWALTPVPGIPAFADRQQMRPCEKLYGVVHRVVVDARGRVLETTVEHVVDPELGRTPEEAAARPIQMDLPAEYLAAVRAFLQRRTYDPTPSHFWTYTVFDPAQPARADISGRNSCEPPVSQSPV